MTDALRALLDGAGISRRRLRTVVRLLTEGPQTLAALVRDSGADRRSVQDLLAALGDDVVQVGDELRLRPSTTDSYRDLVDADGLRVTELIDPLAQRLAEHQPLVARMRQWIAGAPRARETLDHVSATAVTAVRRALWLDSTFDLDRARLLCVGDHDLTSLAVAAINPRVAVTVVDVEDALLEYIDGQAQPSIRCLWADLRFGLPAGAQEWGDLAFTDPPYTPEGVRLFLARALAGLRDRDRSRLVMAYGFPEHHPALGLKVQQAVAGLHLAYEAILPGFNRYHGAQAIGSRSDLYVLRPTARSWRARAGVSEKTNIYTRGTQSVEGAADLASAMPTLRDAAAGPAGLAVEVVEAHRLFAPTTFAAQAIAVDFSADPGSWLLRALLASNAPRLAVLVPNNHADLANEVAQRSLADLVAAKYQIRIRRSTPGPRQAIVEADRVDDDGGAARAVLDRPHGKVGNTWREALIRASGGRLTKNEARQRIRDTGAEPQLLAEQLISLPRHDIATLLRLIAASQSPEIG